MDASLNYVNHVTKRAQRWLSIGAGLGGLAVVLTYIALNGRGPEVIFWQHLLGILAAPGAWLKEVLLGLLFFGLTLIAVIAGAIAGARYICKKFNDSLASYPPPMLFVGGFILGGLVIAAGVIYIICTIIGELS